MNNLKVYKSSAGSGKTFTLVLEYLKIVLQKPEEYKSVLAITFTNKAAGEMKSRIVETLVSLSKGEDIPARKLLEQVEDLKKVNITLNSAKALNHILHDYTSFSISTIDSFFQRILRSLAREINLPLNMEVKVEIDDAILEVTDQLLREVGVDKELTDWLTRLAIQKMDDDKGWNLERDIDNVARQLFKEDHDSKRVLSREQIHEYYEELKTHRKHFETDMKKMGEAMLATISSAGLSLSDFSGGEKSFANYFKKIVIHSKGQDDYVPGKTLLKVSQDPESWAAKSSPQRSVIVQFANENIHKLKEILGYVDENFREYKTIVEILKNIYLFGIVNDLQKKFGEYRNTNNVILLSDTTRLLNNVIQEGDTPFIYEQTGNRFKHLLIDEFQDTSLLQWKNLLPLIINTLGSGNTALVVGDAKQSIYRWRGGNMNLLLNNIYKDLKQFESLFLVENLGVNYRSRINVVNFNNDFFRSAPAIVNEDLKLTGFSPLELAYGSDLHQETVSHNSQGGYVKVRFLPNEKDEEGKNGWKERARKEMLESINSLLESGYSYRDICILVRRKTEGNEIADFLYDNNIEEVISPDSLLISASPKIQFLINVIRFLNNNKDVIARSEIIYFYQRFLASKIEEDWHSVFVDHQKAKQRKSKKQDDVLFEGLEDNIFNRILPEKFTSNLSYLSKLPLYELVEQLISIFGLNKIPDAYIQCFQDLILECTIKINTSIDGFLQWWDTAKKAQETSVNVPENKDAIRIMTIHSSKGLQFPVVILPYCDWPLKPKANDTLWMQTEGSEFDKIGEIAVQSSSRLLETFFQKEYELELSQTVIDNLNLLYVAFTRAEHKLFAFAPVDNENELNTISKLMFRTCTSMNESFDRSTFETGQPELKHEKKIKPVKVVPGYLESYPSNRWQERLALSSHAADLADLLENKKLSKINYGILVHSILASVSELDEIDSVVAKIIFDGLISSEERLNLTEEIKSVLEVEEIRELFDKSYTVLAERELILPTGEILRPDRVIIKDNKATVIDFKTGKREKKHEKQVKEYADVLRQMKYSEVESKVIYLSERSVENIS